MPAARSADPSKYPFTCVTSPTTLRDSILIVGPPLSAVAGEGALAAGALSAAGGGITAAPGAAALALAGSPDASGGEEGSGAADAGAGGTLFSIAASWCFSAAHRSALIAPLCPFRAVSTD